MPLLKIGFIGGGGIAGAHLPHLVGRDDVELTALSDVNPAAKATADTYGIKQFFSDYREMLPLVDGVVICVPTFLHADIAVAALSAGKAVFCEKPLSRTLESADQMEKVARDSGSPLQVGFVRRFDSEWLAWRDIIQQEKIGRPVVWHDMSSNAGPAAPWFYRDEQGGGPFLDGCIHNFDFALHTFGPAEWAFCHGRSFRAEATAIDTGTATVHFKSGDELLLVWSRGIPGGAPAARAFEFIGPAGTLTWPSGVPAGEPHMLVANARGTEEIAFARDALTQGFKAQMDEFVQVARREKAPRAGIRQGRESLELALAVLQSARTAQVVQL